MSGILFAASVFETVKGHDSAIRKYRCLTVSLNHDIIDGVPVAGFVTRLKELIESGFGLLDQEIMAEQASTSPVVRMKESYERIASCQQ